VPDVFAIGIGWWKLLMQLFCYEELLLIDARERFMRVKAQRL
jgi:hypothetical protein